MEMMMIEPEGCLLSVLRAMEVLDNFLSCGKMYKGQVNILRGA